MLKNTRKAASEEQHSFTLKDLFQKIFSLRHVEIYVSRQQQQGALFCMTIQVHIVYCKSYFKNGNYIIGQLRYFGNNLSRTSKQAEIYFMNCILKDFISSLIKTFTGDWVIFGIRVLIL